jgi:Protein of unknown function (DUF1488)
MDANVRFGLLADISRLQCDVRFTPNSGHSRSGALISSKGWALNRQRVRHFFHRSYNTAVGQLPSHDRRLAMPLQRGEVQGYNFNRMAVEFTMVNQGKVVSCSISTAAMDDLEGRRHVKSDQRIDQFMRLREIIEERASRKFFEEQAQADRPVVLRSNDFSS